LELKEIKIIIDLMKRNDLALFQLEREGFKIKLQRGSLAAPGAASGPLTVQVGGAALPAAALAAGDGAASASSSPAASSSAPAPVAASETEAYREINSPMVGTFYQSPSPEAGPFVKVGQEVTEDSVVCIIEAMKVMNEIKAETKGVIAEIVAENGKPVQFGQVLFKVK